ncbi:MAG TPA: AAA family ATPase [Gaiellaceae bacterium]|jgi:class 3 adenylate cyclase/tetratricopeptide (TPR) repeat protein
MERKLATVLFFDLVDSTALVTAVDPEVVRRRVTQYFDRAARCIEQHGGLVEKFAGDAVMAAFGVPRAHEDDAERAVRAAFAIMDAVHELGLEAHAGVEAGQILVDDGDSTFATGEAVNVAARLQQSAGPGEIVLGPGVRRLAAGAVEVEDAGPLEIKGREEPIWTWRAVKPLVVSPRLPAAPFVGREEELELLHNTYARAVRDRRAHLVTVFGEPGVGKSRLVAEFIAGVERATTLTGRALPYGDGVTYWPLAAMIKESAGIQDDDEANEAFDKLRTCCESEAVADLLAAALGVLGAAAGGRHGDDIAWATIQWAEQLADAQPLVLVFEDAQWADERLLDVIEQLARSLRRAPAVLVAVARPELIDARPGWGGGNPRALAVEVGPLDPAGSQELADALLGSTSVPPAQRALLLEKAEGNPLFLEETARMLVEGESADRIPDSVQALVAARIDRLEDDEKRLLQRAALVGRTFWRGALDHLAGEDMGGLLDALLERELVVPEERSTIAGDRAFRFKHGLTREVAYASMTKAERADDHRRFAAWLGEHARDELLEIRAFHLDQAVCLLEELDGEAPAELVHEAAEALEAAGRRAVAREMHRSGRRLFQRTVGLEPTLWRRYWAALAASRLTELDAAAAEFERLLEDARAARDEAVEGATLLGLAEIALQRDSDPIAARTLADAAVEKISPSDLRARFDAHAVLAKVGSWLGDMSLARWNLEAMAELAENLGPDLESLARIELSHTHRALGDREASNRELARAEQLAADVGTLSPRALIAAAKGDRLVDAGDLAAAEAAYQTAVDLFAEAGMSARVAWALNWVADVRALRGDLSGAEEALRIALRTVAPLHERGYRVEAERRLAEVLLERGRLVEAEQMAEAARRTVGDQDVWSQASSAFALALVRERQGRLDEAETLIGDALELIRPTDFAGGRMEQRMREVLERVRAAATSPMRP